MWTCAGEVLEIVGGRGGMFSEAAQRLFQYSSICLNKIDLIKTVYNPRSDITHVRIDPFEVA